MIGGGRVRQPAVAGLFYPRDPDELRAQVRALLDVPLEWTAARGPAPTAVIVPHAGYIYSGSTAAEAYARVATHAPHYRRVLLVGPSHFVPLEGAAVPDADRFRTPLGEVELWGQQQAMAAGAKVTDIPHLQEHSLEVQLPFLQEVLPEVPVLPVVVGHARPEEVAQLIAALAAEPDTLVVCSTDLSHYLPYDVACSVDRRTADAVLALRWEDLSPADACGFYPLRGLLEWARQRGMSVEELALRNSGDTAGDRHRVVGYGAFALH